jgi:VanZ family protein
VTPARVRTPRILGWARAALSKADWRSPLWLWGPVVLQMVIIFAASSIPNLRELPGGISDKSGHSIGYALLGGLFLRAFARGRLRDVTWRRASAAIVVATLYGVSDEFHQVFVPGRSADRYDVLADCIGAAVGVAVGWLAGVAGRWGILDSSS